GGPRPTRASEKENVKRLVASGVATLGSRPLRAGDPAAMRLLSDGYLRVRRAVLWPYPRPVRRHPGFRARCAQRPNLLASGASERHLFVEVTARVAGGVLRLGQLPWRSDRAAPSSPEGRHTPLGDG